MCETKRDGVSGQVSEVRGCARVRQSGVRQSKSHTDSQVEVGLQEKLQQLPRKIEFENQVYSSSSWTSIMRFCNAFIRVTICRDSEIIDV